MFPKNSKDSYSDDEDWEDVIEGIDDSSSSTSPTSDDGTGEGAGRKMKLKNELKKKRAKLTQEEYEQVNLWRSLKVVS